MAKKTKKTEDTSAETAKTDAPQQPDPKTMEQVVKLRSAVRETFGSVAMSMMALPRYRHLTIADLQHLILDPLLRDRIAIAKKTEDKSPLADISGVAIWASVSEDVDKKVREQITNGVFPVRLAADEWNSGKINWIFDVIAQDRASTASVIANFKAVAKDGELRLHPLVTRLVDRETLEKMGAKSIQAKPAPEEA